MAAEVVWEPYGAGPVHRTPRLRLAVVLFLLTCVSTYWANGLTYSLCVMAVLGAHELGQLPPLLRNVETIAAINALDEELVFFLHTARIVPDQRRAITDLVDSQRSKLG